MWGYNFWKNVGILSMGILNMWYFYRYILRSMNFEICNCKSKISEM